MSDTPKFYSDCFLCRRSFRYGPHLYEGRPIKAWSIVACDMCIRANHDGIVPEQHPKLIAYLKAEGIATIANDRGRLDIPS